MVDAIIFNLSQPKTQSSLNFIAKEILNLQKIIDDYLKEE